VTHISEQPVVQRGYVRWKWCLQDTRSITYLVLKFTSIINKSNAYIVWTCIVIESKCMCHDLRRVTSGRFCVFETGNSYFKPSGINVWLYLCTICTFSLVCCHVSTPTSTPPAPSVSLSLSLSHTHTHTNTNKNSKTLITLRDPAVCASFAIRKATNSMEQRSV